MTLLKKAERHVLTACMLMVVLLVTLPATAQNNPVKFSLVEGMGEVSLGKITGITQDANGYMWFTDQDKSCITRFDGSEKLAVRLLDCAVEVRIPGRSGDGMSKR